MTETVAAIQKVYLSSPLSSRSKPAHFLEPDHIV
jgi:hypothetical protein